MTTEPARPRAKRKRAHPAAGARVVVVGAATAGTLAMVGLMVSPAEPTTVDVRTAPAPQPLAAPGSGQIVIVRRHHPASAGTPAIGSSATPAFAPAPAAAPTPAPRPVAPRTTSGGS